MSHTHARPEYEDNGDGRCWHCGGSRTEHPDAGLAPVGPTPENKVHKLSVKEAYGQGYLDGRLFYHDGALWRSLSRAKRAAYDRGNVSGRKSPVRC